MRRIYASYYRIIEYYDTQHLSLRDTALKLNISMASLKTNMKDYGIFIRTQSEARKGKEPWNKDLTKKTDIRVLEYTIKSAITRKGIPSSRKGIIKNNGIPQKIEKRQKSITTDEDLSIYGYMRSNKKSNGAIQWISKESKIQKDASYREKHKEEISLKAKTYYWMNKEKKRIYHQKYYDLHKTEIKARVKKWMFTTEKGRISIRKNTHKRRKRGFIPLNTPLNIEYDWHHLHKELPFVIAIDRELHRSRYGKTHYDYINEKIGLKGIVNKSKEDIEYYVELNYPIQFREYWFSGF